MKTSPVIIVGKMILLFGFLFICYSFYNAATSPAANSDNYLEAIVADDHSSDSSSDDMSSVDDSSDVDDSSSDDSSSDDMSSVDDSSAVDDSSSDDSSSADDSSAVDDSSSDDSSSDDSSSDSSSDDSSSDDSSSHHSLKNLPNPFIDFTTLSFTAESAGPARMIIFNLEGKVIATVFNAEVEIGIKYQIEFDASSLPNGIYISRLIIGTEAVQHSRLVLLR